MPYLESHCCGYVVHGRAYGPDGMLVQTDWDYPATARLFGWNLRRVQADKNGKARHLKRAPNRNQGCDHRSTDGTVNCAECGVTASSFITAAADFLSSRC